MVALEHARRLSNAVAEDMTLELNGLLSRFRDYCRVIFLSLDHIQRTWIKAEDTNTVLTTMYEYLYELYPPKSPPILVSTTDDGRGDR